MQDALQLSFQKQQEDQVVPRLNQGALLKRPAKLSDAEERIALYRSLFRLIEFVQKAVAGEEDASGLQSFLPIIEAAAQAVLIL